MCLSSLVFPSSVFGNVIALLHSRTNLDINNIISLLDFVLSNYYFVYNSDTYKQIQECVMGSAIVANLCMEEIEECTIHNTTVKPKKMEMICWQ